MKSRIIEIGEFHAAVTTLHEGAAVAWDPFAIEHEITCTQFQINESEVIREGVTESTLIAMLVPLGHQGGFHAALYLDPKEPIGCRWAAIPIAVNVVFLAHPPGFEDHKAYAAHLEAQRERAREYDARRDRERIAAGERARLEMLARARLPLTEDERQEIQRIRVARRLAKSRLRGQPRYTWRHL